MNYQWFQQAATTIQEKINVKPKIGLVLGSGLGILADEIQDAIAISYKDIDHFPVSTVEGHAGELVVGTLEGVPVVAMKGRFHFYEGYTQQEVTFPIRVMKELGVETVIVTNAAGGVNPSFSAGDFMLITDHINFMGTNPLVGKNISEYGPRFPDMSEAYNKEYIQLVKSVAATQGIKLQEGVYFGNPGPVYETPAEIRMVHTLGGDAVGMSTVPEVIVANHAGMKVIGISCISNMAAGIQAEPLSHEEVMETTERVKSSFIKLVKGIVEKLG